MTSVVSTTKPPLDEEFYSLQPEELQFFKLHTRIDDDQELKSHIIDVQQKAYEVYGYPCIRLFAFTRLQITTSMIYDHFKELARERNGAVYLELGCCFGTDVRKAVDDGWPIQNIIASDLRKEFWEHGHQLFRSTPTTFPVSFVGGDAFELIAPHAPFYEELKTARPVDLQGLTSLTPLQGHVSAIHASRLFHLFDEERQLELARLFGSLLSPLPGSVIFGIHGGYPKKGLRVIAIGEEVKMFCHSPESWKELWDGQVFRKGSVRVETRLEKVSRKDLNHLSEAGMGEFYDMFWAVIRL
ncbi:hypothetical protein BDQ12DRAFT_711486 [Crucibulum laeve]|uniref:Methyltransferase domain-containing protein n=1 Tax=Crucibulum laeve TaxID=68775 RepID=A0A5C3M473_9AGAR|nr:hypothetical protein BDQ12DRAFT_711486 [Crucibulum laeve]